MPDVNYIPYKLLLKGYSRCTIREKLVWKACEIWFKLFKERLY